MPYLKNKPKAGGAWLPSQVEYGVDCSDPDPANWKPFGRLVEEQAEREAAASSKAAAKVVHPAQ